MLRALPFLALALFPPSSALADTPLHAIVAKTVSQHVLPRMDAFRDSSRDLRDAAQADCSAGSVDLVARYHAAFDDWTGISHLRFGPTETEDRAFAIAFWPDSRGKTPRAIIGLLTGDPGMLTDPDAFREVSIAARGLYALEFLLFDPATASAGSEDANCALIRAITRDVAANGAGIAADWHGEHAALLTEPGAGRRYRNDEEAAQELFKALTTGLQFTSDARLGRPLGTFDRPRPNRAELWRSRRSLRQITLSLEACRDLALILADGDPDLATHLEQLFDRALDQTGSLADPVLAGVDEPQSRFRIESLQQSVEDIRALVTEELGPKLGITAGFNALDGD